VGEIEFSGNERVQKPRHCEVLFEKKRSCNAWREHWKWDLSLLKMDTDTPLQNEPSRKLGQVLTLFTQT